MNSYVIISLIAILILSIVSSAITYNVAWSNKKYCYDQAGDGHFCFETKKACKHTEKHDDEAETPCYNKNRQ
jgi:hypothetical protein